LLKGRIGQGKTPYKREKKKWFHVNKMSVETKKDPVRRDWGKRSQVLSIRRGKNKNVTLQGKKDRKEKMEGREKN